MRTRSQGVYVENLSNKKEIAMFSLKYGTHLYYSFF